MSKRRVLQATSALKVLEDSSHATYTASTGAGLSASYLFGTMKLGVGRCARSSAVEHFVDIEGVTGSIPVVRTMDLDGLIRGPE